MDNYQIKELIQILMQIVSTHSVEPKIKSEANKKLLQLITSIKVN